MSQELDQELSKLKPEELELYKLRHTAEHVLHQAVKELYPNIQLAMGPATEDGFYFDFDASPEGKEPVKISKEDFPAIEKRMRQIIAKNLPLIHQELSEDEAREVFKDNPYKLDWIDRIAGRGENISIYWTGQPNEEGSMIDLCSGPHADSTGAVKAFKLLSVAGAYWHGDENNKMLTRIYGTAYSNKKDLKAHLHRLEEAKKRDHRKIAKEQGLIVFSALTGAGLPLYTPKGAILRNAVYNFSRELNDSIGYGETALPSVNRGELFKVSGHYDKYKEDMFQVKSNYSGDEFFLKPMNCPQHCEVYKAEARSYRDLPVRYSDFSVLYRDEKPGEIHGILRSRAFTTDDGHCFCREDQIKPEFLKVYSVVKKAMEIYGFDYWIRLSLRDPEKQDKYLGDAEVWDRAEARLRELVQENDIQVVDGIGEAAIYGPKLDFMIKDSLNREWQLSTIQLDMIMPGRFGLSYTDQNGEKQTPFMIHRAIVGSERFLGILIEHFAGAFPAWLSPVQAAVIPVGGDHVVYGKLVQEKLAESGIRVELWDQAESMQKRIRLAEKQKIPYMLIVGDKEVKAESVAVRIRGQEDRGVQKLEEFANHINQIITSKSLEL